MLVVRALEGFGIAVPLPAALPLAFEELCIVAELPLLLGVLLFEPLEWWLLLCWEGEEVSLEDFEKNMFPIWEENEFERETEWPWACCCRLLWEALASFCFEMTKRGSTESTWGEEMMLESMAETFLGRLLP